MPNRLRPPRSWKFIAENTNKIVPNSSKNTKVTVRWINPLVTAAPDAAPKNGAEKAEGGDKAGAE